MRHLEQMHKCVQISITTKAFEWVNKGTCSSRGWAHVKAIFGENFQGSHKACNKRSPVPGLAIAGTFMIRCNQRSQTTSHLHQDADLHGPWGASRKGLSLCIINLQRCLCTEFLQHGRNRAAGWQILTMRRMESASRSLISASGS